MLKVALNTINQPFFSNYYPYINSCPIWIILLQTKAELNVVCPRKTRPIKLEPSLILDVLRGYSLKFISDNPATPTDMGYVTMNRTEGIYSKTLQIAEEKSSLWHPHPKNSIITRTLALTITLTLYDQNHQINMFIIKYTNSIDFWVGCHKEILPSRNFFYLF